MKEGRYCHEVQVNKKRVYVPLDPHSLLEIQRHYATLKASDGYRRRITWLNKIPPSIMTSLPATALVEYVGQFPGAAPHGNSKQPEKQYIRTPAAVLEEIGKAVEHGKPKAVYDRMLDRPVRETPRDIKQVKNKRRNVNKTNEDSGPAGNLADQIQHLQTGIHEGDFVQHVLTSKGKVPSVIMYTTEQLLDLRRFCCQDRDLAHSTVLEVDKTFNLTELHLTTTVFKNMSVYRNGTSEHPIFFGPLMLHGSSDFESFYAFFSSLVPKLEGVASPVFGTDEEYALRKGIQMAFPEAEIIACE